MFKIVNGWCMAIPTAYNGDYALVDGYWYKMEEDNFGNGYITFDGNNYELPRYFR